MEFKTIKGQKNFLYSSEEEFHEHRPERPVRHRWNDGEDGEWVFTDDNYVCQILKKFPTKSLTLKTILKPKLQNF